MLKFKFPPSFNDDDAAAVAPHRGQRQVFPSKFEASSLPPLYWFGLRSGSMVA